MSWAAVAAGAGGILAGYLNKDAAGKAEEATRQSAAEIRAAELQKQATLADLKEKTSTGQDYLRRTVNESGSLTPAQQQQLGDLRRTTGNQIRSSAIAGSGRSAASLLRSTEDRFANDALDTNRQRAIGAAGTLSGEYSSAVGGIAGSQSDSGRLSAGLNREAGLYGPAAELATGRSAGTALGNVASAITRGNRPSSYGGLRNDGYDQPNNAYSGSPETNPRLNPNTYNY